MKQAAPFDYGPHILAKEGNHIVALLPTADPSSFVYALLYFQPVTGCYVRRIVSSNRQAILALLWRLECAHAGPLGWPDIPSFGLRLHGLISGPEYPACVHRLSASERAAIPPAVEWC